MSYEMDYIALKKYVNNQLKLLHDKNGRFRQDVIKMISNINFIIDSQGEKEIILNELLISVRKYFYVDDSIYELLKYILENNIVARKDEKDDLLISRWMIFDNFIKQHQYKLTYTSNGYITKFIKEYSPIRYHI